MMVSLQENPTLAIRLGPMAESRLYNIAHPAIFRDPSFACLIHMNRTLQRKSPPVSRPLHRECHNVSSGAPEALPAQNSWAAWGTIQQLGELYSRAFGAVMLTSKAYLQQAEECLQLANASSDVYVKEALTELASDFKAMAKDLEQRNER
jgi:hypothetical protein